MDLLRNIFRWALLIGCFIIGLLYLNSTFYNLWAAGGPPTDIPNVWLHRAIVHFGYTIIAIATGIFVFRVAKKTYKFKGSKAWIIWLVTIVIAIGYPQLKEFLDIDNCLDSGGAWSKEHHECKIENS